MAIEPPGMHLRPPDQSQLTRNSNMNKPQLGTSSDSSDNSLKLRRIEAIQVTILEKELDWAKKIMSLEQSGMIRVNSTGNHESTPKDLSTINETSTTGESSPGQGVHHIKISTRLDGGIAGNINSDQVTKSPVNNGDENLHQTYPCDKDNLPEDKLAPPVDVHNPGEELESIRITNRLNQRNNQDKNFNSIKGRKRCNLKMRSVIPKKQLMGMGREDFEGFKKLWHQANRVKSSNLDSNFNDHINPSSTNPNSRHNGSGKVPAVVVIDGKQDGETQCATVIQYDRNHLAPKIPPPLKNVQKTRGSVAKVRVQIDLTKERPQHVWLGFSKKDPNLGKWQIIEYEDVPSYCIYCKHQGHMIGECSQRENDEETKKNKELEANKKELDKQQNQSSKGN
ncbi:hypothetical protein H5410_003159 [Solanum commersonii]|uniref:DUF4283 domain-containing protein n=1 Tax=Solanum commersonii TaxID=4109 RepID=A0A9J6B4B9_SOLCO|nr:hypothetical protein H5410_003159 [Solanum commersonii]